MVWALGAGNRPRRPDRRLEVALLALAVCVSCSQSEGGTGVSLLASTRASLVEAAARIAPRAVDAHALPAHGQFTADDVPLGLEREAFESAVETGCKLTSRGIAAPVLGPLTNYEPPIEDFFPAEDGVHLGLANAWGWVGALSANYVDVLDMRSSGMPLRTRPPRSLCGRTGQERGAVCGPSPQSGSS